MQCLIFVWEQGYMYALSFYSNRFYWFVQIFLYSKLFDMPVLDKKSGSLVDLNWSLVQFELTPFRKAPFVELEKKSD